MKEVSIKDLKIGGDNPLFLIAGPCVIENENMVLKTAEKIKEICDRLKFPFIFKSSYSKANRLSFDSYRGPGLLKGLKILEKVKKKLSISVLTDVHCVSEVKCVSEIVDVIQIPAFLCRQSELVEEAAKTGKIVNIKKGQFLAPWDMKNIIEKAEKVGNNKIIVTERGTSFGYNNLVVDMRSLGILRRFGYPVVFDVTHSLQLPGGLGKQSGGSPEFIFPLARAGVAFGCDGIYIETHPQPAKALSDSFIMLPLSRLKELLIQIVDINKIVRGFFKH